MSESQFEKLLKTLSKKDAEIKRLREENERLRDLVDAGKDDRKAIDELVDENKRLRKLLRQCQPFVDRLQPPTFFLSVEIAKELK